MGYLGSKAQAGVWQRIICQMPAHSVYVEPFAGSAQIFFRKRPAVRNVIIDVDAGVHAKIDVAFRKVSAAHAGNGVEICTKIICGDALRELATLKTTLPADAVIYCDPPYLLSTRTSRHRYAHEFSTDEQHTALLTLLKEMPCRVLISGYPSKLYDKLLRGWRCISYQTRTRGRTLTECLWCNFPEPTELHDWRYFGNGHRERVTLKRFAARFVRRLDNYPPLKRNFVLHLIDVHQRRK